MQKDECDREIGRERLGLTRGIWGVEIGCSGSHCQAQIPTVMISDLSSEKITPAPHWRKSSVEERWQQGSSDGCSEKLEWVLQLEGQ